MSIITAEIVERLRGLNIQTYEGDRQRIKADFGNERKFAADYNGRQILELLQNADDAHTDSVRIELDEENCILRIANNGDAFSAEGLDSLRLAGNSSKNKREFIGNKGLGFRAVLNWVNRIRIYTRGYVLEFSPTIATREFELLIPDKQVRQKMIDEREDLLPGTSPFPVLAYMDYEVNSDLQEWKTIIELRYNSGALEDIRQQLNAVTPEVLLFLNYTQRVEIWRNGEPMQNLERMVLWERGEDSRIRVNEIEWNVRDSGEHSIPDNDKKFYRFKIAWRDDLSDTDAVFYTFFPTKVHSHLPCLIHGTFELTTNRDHLAKDTLNDFLLNKIAETLGEIAETKLMGRVPDWKAYDLLYPTFTGTNERLTAFYDKLSLLRQGLKIYPSVDGSYYRRAEVAFYGNDFSEFIIQRKLGRHCGILLKNFNQVQAELSKYSWPPYTDKSVLNVVRRLSDNITSLKIRCTLVRFLFKFQRTDGRHRKIKFPLILDENGDIVQEDYAVFLIKQNAVKDYKVPSYVKLRFISPTFYQALIREFEPEIQRQRSGSEDLSRPLKRLLSEAVNLGSNDITDVIASITRAFTQKREGSGKQETIDRLYKEYVGCLFRIFSANPERRNSINEPIFLRSRSGESKRSHELLFGLGFLSGTLTEELFKGVFADADFLPANEFWGLGNGLANSVLLEDFFSWLGVNKLTRLKREIKSFDRWGQDGYVKFVFDYAGWPDYESHKNYEVTSVQNIELILKSRFFTREKCLAWIISDPRLYKLLRDDDNGDSFSYTYNGIKKPIYKKPSYLKYQLHQAGFFKNVFADEEVASQLGLRWVNPKHELFIKLDIAETTVLETLRQLGGMIYFSQLSPTHIFKLLDSAGQTLGSPRKLYEWSLAYFKQRDGEDFSAYLKNLKVWAIKGADRKFLPGSEVYYTDHATLPERMSSDFWMFDFPKKRGAAQIAKAFGLNTFKDLNISLKGTPVIHAGDAGFQQWLETIKPYLLTYRLSNLREDAAARKDTPSLANEAIGGTESSNQLKKLNISVCSTASYSVDSGPAKQLQPCEFIPLGERRYYLCAPQGGGLEEWKQLPAFCEAFAEILCMSFDTQKNKDNFKAIFKDRPDLRDTLYSIDADTLQPVLKEASMLLGLPTEELAFWRAALACKDHKLPETVTTREALQKELKDALGYAYSESANIDYIAWTTRESYALLKKLEAQTGVSLRDIKAEDENFPGVSLWHRKQFQNVSYELEEYWKLAWWRHLSGKGERLQRTFLDRCAQYNSVMNEVAVVMAAQFAFLLSVNYREVLLEALSSKARIKISDKKTAAEPVKNRYAQLLSEAQISDEEFSLGIRSLLFFNGHDTVIRQAIESISERAKPLSLPTTPAKKTAAPTTRTPIHEVSFEAGILGNSGSISSRPGRTPSIYDGSSEAKKSEAGKRAEEAVYNELRITYPVVQWVSRYSDNPINRDDTAGYDMRYKCSDADDADWFFVEVKSMSGDAFIISRNEVDFGMRNPQTYQLAVFKEGAIYLDKMFFQDEERCATFQTMLAVSSIKPTHFEVAWLKKNSAE